MFVLRKGRIERLFNFVCLMIVEHFLAFCYAGLGIDAILRPEIP